MRLLRVLPLLLTIAVIYLLDHPLGGSLPALGRLIDPLNGAMAAAEPVDENFNKSLKMPGLQAPASIWLDTSLIPHIRAGNDHDLYYAQGYIHAYFRLWQMDMQTRAAWGRVSEVAGAKAIDFDRGMRREGMVWGAQASLKAMEAEPRTKAMLDAYRDGINTYIHSLNYRALPLEYKLMSFAPEDWTNLRTALLMKYMARDLTGKTDDIAYTLLRDQLGQQQFDFLFPERIKGSKPVIPDGTKHEAASLPEPPVPEGDIWTHFDSSKAVAANQQAPIAEQESGIGSNNWAISGKHTASGKPILCNDPHLGLNLPSLWYEMQLTAPGINTYGASLPGAPGIVIGFNDKISWGFTNNYRDVKDFYEIREVNVHSLPAPPPPNEGEASYYLKHPQVDRSKEGLLFGGRYYEFSGGAYPLHSNVEVIKVKGQGDVLDTVLYTIHGPVTYDPSFPDPAKSGKLLACTWMAHRGSNELLATYLLNRAGDYSSFTQAITHFECPAQNIAYADGAGNIAIWGQGQFINKWKDQGKYVMKGTDSSTLWGANIPMSENPHVLNPAQGYVASANQQVTDSTYPYWYNGSFVEWRSWEINDRLERTFPEQKAYAYREEAFTGLLFTAPPLYQNFFQTDARSYLAYSLTPMWRDSTWPINLARAFLNGGYVDLYESDTIGTYFQVFWSQLYKDIWQDEFPNPAGKYPSSEVTVQLLRSDSTSKYYDDRKTQQVESLRDIVQRAIKETRDSVNKLKNIEETAKLVNDSTSPLAWYKVKNTTLTHLAKLPAFSYSGLKIGGWSNTINAVTGNHGPSWRMIVEMDSIPKAYAIYPGGQSGNPGSKHYGDFVQQWVEGKYHAIQFLTAAIKNNPLTYTWTLTP
jgi:penicillin amidase